MRLISLVLVKAMCFATVAFAYPSKDSENFCHGIKKWPKKAPILAPGQGKGLQETDLQKHFNTIDVGSALKNHMQKGFIFVDTRKHSDRKVGQIPYSLKITANPKDTTKKGSANEFSEKTLLKKINKLAKKIAKKNKKGGNIDLGLAGSYSSVSDLKDLQFIIFCNGRKCHRSSFGGCELLRLGVNKKNIHIMLDGYPGWSAANGPKS